MNKKILIITSAHINSDRNKDYIESLESIMDYSNFFDRIFILECFSKKMSDLEYLKKFNIEIVLSEFDNSNKNYGINEFLHIKSFIENNKEIGIDDYIFKITGRYKINGDYLLNAIPFNGNILAKLDGDIWDKLTGNKNRGVHTFYFLFKKNFIKDFIQYINDNNLINSKDPVEWIVKDYMLEKDENFYNGLLGVETNFSGNGWKILT